MIFKIGDIVKLNKKAWNALAFAYLEEKDLKIICKIININDPLRPFIKPIYNRKFSKTLSYATHGQYCFWYEYLELTKDLKYINYKFLND